MIFFEAIITNARLTDSERNTEAVALWHRMEIENPELVRAAEDSLLMKDFMASFEEVSK